MFTIDPNKTDPKIHIKISNNGLGHGKSVPVVTMTIQFAHLPHVQSIPMTLI